MQKKGKKKKKPWNNTSNKADKTLSRNTNKIFLMKNNEVTK